MLGVGKMNVIEAIRRKRAVRQYKDEPLPVEVVEEILWAGRRAQSSKNTQPWHFIAIRNRDTLAALATMGDYATHLPKAALGVAIVTPDPKAFYWVMFDAGQAAAYMQLAALELGVGSGIITLHRPEGSRELLGYPDDMYLTMVLAFGYPAEPAALAPASRPGGRRPLDEVVHFERWEEVKA
jgi:nitroreductase